MCILVVFLILLLLILLLKILLKEEFIVEFTLDIPCSNVYKNKIIPEEKSQSCELCCDKYAKEQNWSHDFGNHGWKPNSFWNNKWHQIETNYNNDKYYQLICNCNVEK